MKRFTRVRVRVRSRGRRASTSSTNGSNNRGRESATPTAEVSIAIAVVELELELVLVNADETMLSTNPGLKFQYQDYYLTRQDWGLGIRDQGSRRPRGVSPFSFRNILSLFPYSLFFSPLCS